MHFMINRPLDDIGSFPGPWNHQAFVPIPSRKVERVFGQKPFEIKITRLLKIGALLKTYICRVWISWILDFLGKLVVAGVVVEELEAQPNKTGFPAAYHWAFPKSYGSDHG